MRHAWIAAAAAALCACSKLASEPVKLYVAAPMTGDLAAEGLGMERAVTLAVEEEMAKGGLPVPVKVETVDDKADPFAAAAAARRVVEDPAAFAVVGHLTSGCAIEASRVYSLAPIAMITPSATAPDLTLQQTRPEWSGARVVFRLPPSDAVQGDISSEYAARRLSLRRFAVMHDRTPYGLGLSDSFRKGFEKRAGTVTRYEGVSRGETDFSAALRPLLAEAPDGIFFAGTYVEAGRFIKQARELGYRGAYFSGDGAKSPDFFDFSGPAGDGAFMTVSGVPLESLPSAESFIERYQKRFPGAVPRTFDHYGYVAAKIALAALRKSGPDRGKAVETIRDLHHDSMVGLFIFDSKGDSLKSLITMMKADQGRRRFDVFY